MGRIRAYLRQHHLGLIAIFVALSGTAYAVDGPLPGQNQVGSRDIIDGEVFSADLRNGQVTSADVRNDTAPAGSLRGLDIANESLTGADVADGGLTKADVLDQSLTGSDIEDNTINADDAFGLRGNDDIENNSLTGADVNEASLHGVNAATVGGVEEREIARSTSAVGGVDVVDESGLDLDLNCGTFNTVPRATLEAFTDITNARGVLTHVRSDGEVSSAVFTRFENGSGLGAGASTPTSPASSSGFLSYRTPSGVQIAFDFSLIVRTDGFGTTNDCFLIGHLRKS